MFLSCDVEEGQDHKFHDVSIKEEAKEDPSSPECLSSSEEDEELPLTLPIAELKSLIDHVVFPSKLSKNSNKNICKSDPNDPSFLNLLYSVLDEASYGSFMSLIPRTCTSIKTWKSNLSTDPNSNYGKNVSEAISSLPLGGLLPFYFQAYNVTLILSKPQNTDPDSVVISWFQVSIDELTINSKHKMKASYPEYSFVVPFSNFIKSTAFAAKLHQLQMLEPDPKRNENEKANEETSKLVEWLTVTLMGSKDPSLTQSDDFISIQKSIIDEALSSGFRRNGLWMALKVSLQLSLVNELGREEGTFMYKLIMIEVLRRINEEHNNRDFDISMEILAKMAKKLEKSNESKSAIENRTLKVTQELIVVNATKSMSKTKTALDAIWEQLIDDQHPRPRHNQNENLIKEEKSDEPRKRKILKARRLKFNFNKLSYSEEYLFGQNRMQLLNQYLNQRKKDIEKSCRSQDMECSSFISKSVSKDSKDEKQRINFESLIRKKQRHWTPTNLRNETLAYMEKVQNSCTDNPIATSRVVLSLLKSLQILDSAATEKYPILLEHKLFDFDASSIIQKLLVRTHEEFELAKELDIYFQKRKVEAKNNYPSLISETEPNPLSPAVRLAQNDGEMKMLKTQILTKISEDEAGARIKIQQGIAKYKELERSYRDAECDCQISLMNPSRHYHGCAKGSAKQKMECLTVTRFGYAIPMKSNFDQDAVIFELLIPEEVAAMRDILFISWIALASADSFASMRIQSIDRLPNFSPWNHRRNLFSHDGIPIRPMLFYLGATYMNLYKTVSPMESERKLIVRNDYSKYLWKGNIYRPNLSFCLKLESNSPYANLQCFLQDWTHTPNEVLTKQGKCNAGLQLAEFVEYGSLRAGHRLQYRNIYRNLSCKILSFHSQPVFTLIAQALWQLGPLDRIVDGNFEKYYYSSHADLQNSPFVEEMLKVLDDLVDKTEDNWVASFTLMTVISVTQRILEFNAEMKAPALNLLNKCRSVLEKWMTTIKGIIAENPGKTGASLKQYLIDAAICGALTFSVSSNLIPCVLETEADALHWITCMGIIHSEISLGGCTSNHNLLRRTMLNVIEETGKLIIRNLNLIVRIKNHQVLQNYVKLNCNHQYPTVWTAIKNSDNSESRIYGTEYQADSKEPTTNSVLIDIISGEFLVNGKPTLKLPKEILQSQDYKRVFTNTEFSVRSSGRGGLFTASSNVKGAQYEFMFSTDHKYKSLHSDGFPLIIEKRGTTTCELIPVKLIKRELPFLLVQGFSHWWNRRKNSVEFRPQLFESKDFAKPEYILHLNSKDLVEVNTKHTMTYIGEKIHDKILNLLRRFESPKFILIWKQSGEIVTKLPRFGLSFRWQNDHLVCPEYNDMRVKEDFHLKTLIGLQRFLILEETVEEDVLKTRKILVPHGELAIKREQDQQHHSLSINIEEDKLRKPSFFVFDINDKFRTLNAGKSSAAWLYLAALHGATSCSLPDPFTGLTGTEMAIIILQSGHCWSCRPYDIESLSTLKFINSLSPKRNVIEKIDDVPEQSVVSIKGLSSYAAFDGYHLIIKKLIVDSNQLSFLFPNSGESHNSFDPDTTSSLNTRAYWKSIVNYNHAGWIKEEVLPEFSEPPECNIFHPEERFTSDNLMDLHLLSILTEEWNAEQKSHTNSSVSTLNKLIYGSNSREGFEGLKPSLDDLAFLTNGNFRDYWMQLYAKAMKCGQGNLRCEWKLILSDLLFNKEIDFDHLCILHTVAVNYDKFPEPPTVLKYISIDKTTFDGEEIKRILEANKKAFQFGQYRAAPLIYEKAPAVASFANGKKEWDREVASQISKLVSDMQKQWDGNSRDVGIKLPVSTHINHPHASAAMNQLFQSWSDNEKLKGFIENVDKVLSDCFEETNGNSESVFKRECFEFEDLEQLPDPDFDTSTFNLIVDLPKISRHPEASQIYQDGLCDKITDIPSHHAFKYFQSKLSNYNELSGRLWGHLEKAANNSPRQAYLKSAGLSRRIVPITVLPKLLAGETSRSLKDLLGAISVVWTQDQRAVRIMKYILAGESRDVNRQRELETFGHQNWNPKEYPEWLILELEMNVMIRNVQVDVAKHMLDSSEGSSVTQLNMGEGKTSLIVPMLVSTLTRSTDSCVRVNVLKSLYETNYKGLTHTLGGMLDQRVYLFPCARDYKIDEQQVDFVLEMHKEVMNNRGVVLTVPEHRLTWELKAYENSGKNTPICRKLMDLVGWLNENSRDILDESDEILSAKYQKVYAMGTSEKIDDLYWKVTQSLLKKLPEKLKSINFMINLINQYECCIEIDADQKCPPEIFRRCRLLNYTNQSDQCYQDLIQQLALEFITDEFPKLDETVQGSLLKFLTETSFNQSEYEMLVGMMECESLKNKFKKAKVMAELLSHPGVLKSALSKRWKVNYGVNPKGQRRIAVPFRAKDVAHEKTEFGHPLMAIVLTQLSYYYSGLKDEHLFECFKMLEKSLDNPALEFDSWLSAIDIERRPNIPYNSINLKFPHQRIKLFDALRMNMETIDFWLSHCVFPKEVKSYPDKITCTAWDLCSGKKRTTGFSGTNDMSILLPLAIAQRDLPQLEATNKEVRSAVEKSENYEHLESWITTSQDVLRQLAKNDIQILIDAGALMTDMTNFQVAEEWLKINDSIEAVVYFNQKDELTVRTREKVDCPFGLSPLSEKLELCAVYLDDEHTRGTDLRFPDGAVGCVTLGGRMTRDKLVQACMRLRLLQSGRHQAFFLASRESHNQIKSLMSNLVDKDSNPTAVDVMNWVCKNSEHFQKEGLVFWAKGGLNFVKMRSAILNFQSTESYSVLAQQIQEGSSQETVSYKPQNKFLDVILANFDSAQRNLVKNGVSSSSKESVKIEIKNMFAEMKKSVSEVISREIPEKKCFSNNLDEEQEREIENEVEEEREISRPRSAMPSVHKLDPLILQFVQRGILNLNLTLFTTAFKQTPIRGVYATKDFLSVAVCGTFLRPVNWIATGIDSDGSPVGLLLSPFEVNELIPEYRKDDVGATIHMFAPRLRADQSILLNVLGLQLSGDHGATMISEEALAKIHIYAGSLYFDPTNEEEKYYLKAVEELEEFSLSRDFDVRSFIGKVIEDRHQHFPKCDVHKFLKW